MIRLARRKKSEKKSGSFEYGILEQDKSVEVLSYGKIIRCQDPSESKKSLDSLTLDKNSESKSVKSLIRSKYKKQIQTNFKSKSRVGISGGFRSKLGLKEGLDLVLKGNFRSIFINLCDRLSLSDEVLKYVPGFFIISTCIGILVGVWMCI